MKMSGTILVLFFVME